MKNKKNIILLGSTGSIGESALRLLRENKDKFNRVIHNLPFGNAILWPSKKKAFLHRLFYQILLRLALDREQRRSLQSL